MESLHILNIVFAWFADGKSTGSGKFNFFYISLLKSLNLVLISSAKLDGHWATWTGCRRFEENRKLYTFKQKMKYHYLTSNTNLWNARFVAKQNLVSIKTAIITFYRFYNTFFPFFLMCFFFKLPHNGGIINWKSTFWRRHEHLLKVLRTFNLSPVSKVSSPLLKVPQKW